ncbi:hypothetical protein MKW98_031481 [Papaver atlanticum]|uniref:Neprosin PEP catalytic domain-containing protein n=1 Tax=Papaver atlanticum TaxID=357466 RepID=A0AAD4X9C8_9MAGN|nr:hypothetical protein MKW98_031481 [Papaver atlanticum]
MLTFIDLVLWLLILISLTHEELIEGKTIQNVVNKSIIKTIKVETDEIIDCYDIYRQPSLNHHLLCNHTIQMAPSSYPKGMKSNNFGTFQLTQTWHKYGLCPEGTIPIRRKGKNYDPTLLHKHSPLNLSPYKTNVTSPYDFNGVHVHEYATIDVEGNFLGAQAKINLWQPVTEIYGEMSISQIWVTAGPDDNINTIEAGWQVYRKLHGDDYTRFFIFWTNDGYKSSGCYDLVCNGFVQISSTIALGCNFTEVSTFNGSQKDATFSIYKDQSSGHWWVQLQGISVGYYPSFLFKELSKRATQVSWGGEITNWKSKGRHTTTQMGSGHFPSEGGWKTSSYFNWVQVVNKNYTAEDPKNVVIQVTNPYCYDLKIDDKHYDTNGYGFYYGGPGYNDKCQ